MAGEWSKGASLYDGPRAVGGSLRVEGGRLRFEPHAFDRALKGRELNIPLDSIHRLTLTNRSPLMPRRHLLVEANDDVRARFLINGAWKVLIRLSEDAKDAGAVLEVIGLD